MIKKKIILYIQIFKEKCINIKHQSYLSKEYNGGNEDGIERCEDKQI